MAARHVAAQAIKQLAATSFWRANLKAFAAQHVEMQPGLEVPHSTLGFTGLQEMLNLWLAVGMAPTTEQKPRIHMPALIQASGLEGLPARAGGTFVTRRKAFPRSLCQIGMMCLS